MNLTSEQTIITEHVNTTPGLTMVSAIAGSGKTTLLTAIAKILNSPTGLYLAYNKAIATEASRKFPKSIHCSTTHSLAYQPTVKALKLKLGAFNYRTIKEKITYDNKLIVIQSIREFCLSKYTSYSDFAEQELDLSPFMIQIGNSYLTKMQDGTIDCTHEFYLKLFHILLATGELDYDEFDIIMLDEAGDLNEVTLEIFKLLPAKRKVMVGDPHQNIYTFNHTINCFAVMAGQGEVFPMSQSFRVSATIAKSIEGFCQTYLEPTMEFKGVEIEDPTIKTQAYISRTNGALIDKMMELNELGISYGLTRTAKQIFDLPLLLCGLKYKGFIANAEYKHLQEDVNQYYETEIKEEHASVLSYILAIHKDDASLKAAANVIMKHGRGKVIECYEEARKHEKTKSDITLATAHSSKGLEFDEVTILNDLNDSIADIVYTLQINPETVLDIQQLTELNLYYVAISRVAKKLNNATYAKEIK